MSTSSFVNSFNKLYFGKKYETEIKKQEEMNEIIVKLFEERIQSLYEHQNRIFKEYVKGAYPTDVFLQMLECIKMDINGYINKIKTYKNE